MSAARFAACQLLRSSLFLDARARSMLDTVFTIAGHHNNLRQGKERMMQILSELISRHDPVKSLEQIRKWFFPSDEYAKQLYSREIPAILSNLPLDSLDTPESPEQMTRKNWDDLKEYLLIGLVWAGTEKEQRDASDELRRLTGRTFANPADWSAWWFQKLKR